MVRKLGKDFPEFDKRTLRLSQYVDIDKLPPPPAEDDNYIKTSEKTWALNNKYGCCVVAGAVHLVQVHSSMASREQIISDAVVEKTYFDRTGGVDSGLNELTFLKWWTKNQIAGHPLGAFVAVNPQNQAMMKTAIHLFGGVMLGIGLPLSAQDQTVWDMVNGGQSSIAYSWGGHCTIVCKYDNQGNMYHYTWADIIKATPQFAIYYDEAYALLSLDWFGKDHKSPDGFAYKDLLSDANRLRKKG